MEKPLSLEDIAFQESDLHLTRFDADTVWRLGRWLVEKVRHENLPVAVSLTRGGQRIFHFANDGTSLDNDTWLDRKTRTVYRFGHSSLYMGRKLAAASATPQQKYNVSESRYSFHGGAFPVFVKNVGLVGVLAVSGLAQEDDHALAVEALRAFLKK